MCSANVELPSSGDKYFFIFYDLCFDVSFCSSGVITFQVRQNKVDKLENLKGLTKNQIKPNTNGKLNKSPQRENQNTEIYWGPQGEKWGDKWGSNSILSNAIKWSFPSSPK